MGRVFNAIELNHYHACPSEASGLTEQVVGDDQTLDSDFASPDAADQEEPEFVEAPSPA